MFTSAIIFLAFLYFIWHNDRLFNQFDPSERRIEEVQWTSSQIKQAAKKLRGTDAFLLKPQDLPPKTGRKYIIVGGTGFIGSWIVATLLRRGEDPKNIRIIDLQPPCLPEQVEQLAAGVEFVRTDITDRDSAISAFTKPWRKHGSEGASSGLTVFHCVAVLTYFERHATLLPRSARVNIGGTLNVNEASKAAGADILLFTSSCTVGPRPTRLLSFPWEFKRSKLCTQLIYDEGEAEGKGGVVWLSRSHRDFTSNYAETKFRAELLIRDADKANGGRMRTGILRPGAVIYGPTPQDPLFLGLLGRKSNPLWSRNTAQNILYIENCVAAHLLYEQRLLETQRGGKDVGGRAYLVADQPCRFGDLTQALSILSGGKTTFFNVSTTIMYLLSHLVEGYELVYYHLPFLQKLLPRVRGDLIKLQPASHQSMLVNLYYDDSLIRAPVEKGGLGYQGKVSSLDALCHTTSWLQEHVLNPSG